MYFPTEHNHMVVFCRKINTLLRNTQRDDAIQESYALSHVKFSRVSYHYHNDQHYLAAIHNVDAFCLLLVGK
jgi:hypothetical protein